MTQWPAGVTAQAFDPESSRDLDAAVSVMLAHEREFCAVPDLTRATVMRQMTGPVALTGDHRIAFRGSTPVGVVIVESDAPRREVFIDVYAVPGEDPAVTDALVAHGLACARRVAASVTAAPGDGWHVDSGCVLEDVRLSASLASAGLSRQRIYWRMVRSLDGVAATAPAAPAGVTLEVAQSPVQLDELYAVYCDSFSGHFGYTHRTREQYIDSITHGEFPTPERWWLARLDGRPVGLCIQDDSRAEFATGWVRTLGVVPVARGLGIARWLLERSFADAASRGMRDIGLTVDSDNDTGATRLYESVGMKAHLSIALWSMPL